MKSHGLGFVGRQGPLKLLKASMGDALRGHGSLVLVTGEPGIGKSCLARGLAAEVESDASVLWGACWADDCSPPFWPWRQVLRELASSREIGRFLSESGTSDDELAGAVPPSPPLWRARDFPPPAPAPEAAGIQLFAGVTSVLKRAASRQPLLVVLDDLHVADATSICMLRFLVQDLSESRILVVGTYRNGGPEPDHRLTSFVASVGGERELIALSGMTPDEVRGMIAEAAGMEPSPDVVSTVYQATNGNPSLVRRLVRHLGAADPSGHAPTWAGHVTDATVAVGEVVGWRLARVSSACRDLLQTAATVGDAFSLTVLAHVTGQSPMCALEVIEQAVAARLVEEIPGTANRFRFVHTLLREVLCREVSLARRVALHRRVGEAIETQFGDDLEPHLAELSHHFWRALPGGDPAKARDYASRAGQRALRCLAYGEAVEHFTRALDVIGEWDPGNRRLRGDLLLALGRAETARGRLAEAEAAFQGVAAIAQETGDAPLLSQAALGLAMDDERRVVDDVAIGLLEEARSSLGLADSPWRLRVLARLSNVLCFPPWLPRRAALGREAVDLARRLGETATLAAVLCDYHAAKYGSPSGDERLTIAAEVVELAERCGDRELALRGRRMRLGDLCELGDAISVESELNAYEAAAKQLHRSHLWPVIVFRTGAAILACRFDEAERLRGSLAFGQGMEPQSIDCVFQGLLAFVQGRHAQYEPVIREFVDRYPTTPWRSCLALALAAGGRLKEARAELDQLVAHDFMGVPRSADWLPALAVLALTATALEDGPAAAAVYRELIPYGRCCVPLRWFGPGLGSVAYFLGLLAMTLGRWDEAVDHFECAIEVNGRIGAVGPLGNSRYQYGAALLARGRAEDQSRAHTYIREALEMAHHLDITLAPSRSLGPGAGGSGRPFRPQFHEEGEYWTIAYRTGMFRLRRSVGLGYLAQLLARPHEAIAAVALTNPSRLQARQLQTVEGRSEIDTGDAGEVLDERAEQAYRRRLEDLRETFREAESWNDRERAVRAQEEMAVIAEHLAAALGLNGRRRIVGSHAERARVSATKAIRATLRRISRHDRHLAEHLGRSIRTGHSCAYAPAPGEAVSWML